MTSSYLSDRDERKPFSGPWTSASPDRVGRPSVDAHRIHGLHIQSEAAQAGRGTHERLRIATLTLWEYDGSTYREVNQTVDNTPPDYYDEYAVAAPCKPLHQYHVEFEAQGFHGNWDSEVVNSDAQIYC